MEDVACTTNPQELSDDVSLKASKIIMMKREFSGIRDSISSIIIQKDEDEIPFEDGKYVRCLALTILANVMSGLSKQKILTKFI